MLFRRSIFSSKNIIAIPIGKRESPPIHFSISSSSKKISSRTVDRRRKLKTLSRHLPFRPLLRFLYVYVWQKGFLDGAEGYYFARLHGFYEFLSVAKTRELLKATRAPRLTVGDVAAPPPAADYVRSRRRRRRQLQSRPKKSLRTRSAAAGTVAQPSSGRIPISSERFQFSRYSRSHATRF